MIKYLFKKIKSNHNNVRTNEAIVYTDEVPCVGENIMLFAESLSFKDGVRRITTTEIKSVKNIVDGYEFETQNSTYSLERLPDDPN